MMESTDSSSRKQATLSVPKIMPRVSLYYWPPFVLPGDELKVSLSVDGKLPEDMKLRVELISELGEIAKLDEITLPLKSANEQGKNPLSVKFVIPAELSKGTYILQVRNNNNILDTARLDISENENFVKAVVSKSESFRKALEQEDFVSEAMDFCSYDNAFKSQRKAAELYEQAGEVKIAARSWQELGETLLKNNEFSLSKEALQASLSLWSKIEDSEEKQIAVEQLNQEIEIIEEELSYCLDQFPLTIKNFALKIKAFREELNLSEDEAALLLPGCTSSMIRNYETEDKLKKLEKYMQLAEVLGCPIYRLIEYPVKTQHINSRLSILRERKQHSVDELHIKSGVSLTNLKKWEQGDDLLSLKKYLDVYYSILKLLAERSGHLYPRLPSSPKELQNPQQNPKEKSE
jgi:DNA-binding transcriptional regulator YiaG